MREITGLHLIIDGYVVDSCTLEPEPIISAFDQLVKVLDMQYLQRPMALRVAPSPAKLDSEEDEGGWSVACQITTSHITLHGWPLRRAFMCDIFSCKPFNAELAKSTLFEALNVEKACVQVIVRKGPTQPQRSTNAR